MTSNPNSVKPHSQTTKDSDPAVTQAKVDAKPRNESAQKQYESGMQHDSKNPDDETADGGKQFEYETDETGENENDEEDDEDPEHDSEDDGPSMEEVRAEEDTRDELLEDIAKQLIDQETKDVFAIGGTVKLPHDKPVIIRWGSNLEDETGKMCQLPSNGNMDAEAAFAKLRGACQPATFGLGTKDVLDEEYRKASKMDAEDFCTNLNLAQYSIMDTIAQTLVQSVWPDKKMRGVTAEMYKLNIYSGPSGKFKKHVDTPRAEAQMGSLVICLPYAHTGGALLVRHGKQEIKFDWSNEFFRHRDVHWAAFFSDCEHEIEEVTFGHRVTLTYNLYWTKHGGANMARELSALDQKFLPFYDTLERLMACPAFLPRGGLIGFKCTHGYPHTSRAGIKDGISQTLKGLDMLVFQALERVVGNAGVSAVIKSSQYDDYGYDYEYDENYDEYSP